MFLFAHFGQLSGMSMEEYMIFSDRIRILIGKPVVELRNPLNLLYVPPLIKKALWMHRLLRRIKGKKEVL